MHMRHVRGVVLVVGLVMATTASTLVAFGGDAFATTSVTIAPSAPYKDTQNITVSGSGFPTRAQDSSGLSIIECSDPDGTTANLPIDDSGCDATTANPLPVLTDSNGNFSTSYTMSLLSTSDGSSIDCDTTNYCVLWVGEDYINSFTGVHAFSSAFHISPALTPQTISFTTNPPSSPTVGGPTYTVGASATSGLPVSLTIDSTATSECSIASSVVHFLAAGTCKIDANQAGNGTYAPATQQQQSFTVKASTLTPQTISFTTSPPSPATAGGPTYTVAASSTSGLPVSLTIDSTATSECSIASSVVHFLAAGTCKIDANQAGNGTYAPATQQQQSFTVSANTLTPQTISFTTSPPSPATAGGPTYTVAASSTSGLPVSLTIDSTATSECSIASSVVHFLAAGTCKIDANQAGNGTYAPATPAAAVLHRECEHPHHVLDHQPGGRHLDHTGPHGQCERHGHGARHRNGR